MSMWERWLDALSDFGASKIGQALGATLVGVIILVPVAALASGDSLPPANGTSNFSPARTPAGSSPSPDSVVTTTSSTTIPDPGLPVDTTPTTATGASGRSTTTTAPKRSTTTAPRGGGGGPGPTSPPITPPPTEPTTTTSTPTTEPPTTDPDPGVPGGQPTLGLVGDLLAFLG